MEVEAQRKEEEEEGVRGGGGGKGRGQECVVTCLIRGVADGIPNGSHAWKQREERLSNRLRGS